MKTSLNHFQSLSLCCSDVAIEPNVLDEHEEGLESLKDEAIPVAVPKLDLFPPPLDNKQHSSLTADDNLAEKDEGKTASV